MNKLIPTLTSVLLLGATLSNAGSGIFGAGVVLDNDGTTTLYEATLLGDARHAPSGFSPTLDSTGFHLLNLGTFDTATDTLFFKGGEMLTYKNGVSNVTGSNVYYKIDGNAYSSAISLSFNEDNVNTNAGDQRWYTQGSSFDLLSGLSNGAHTLTVYFDAPSSDGTHFENNGGSDFTANFTVIPETSSLVMLGLTAVAAGLVLRKRKRA